MMQFITGILLIVVGIVTIIDGTKSTFKIPAHIVKDSRTGKKLLVEFGDNNTVTLSEIDNGKLKTVYEKET